MLLYTPRKVIYQPNDPFFEEGNIVLRAYWLERDAENERDAALIRQEANLLAEDLNRPIYCQQKSCLDHHRQPRAFYSTAAYEAHYEAMHNHVCTVCHKPFPSAYWLQIHLDESHNVLIEIQKERGDKVFQCFVESCTKNFISPKMRRLHLIDKHHYPKTFPFDIVKTGSLSFEERQRRARRYTTKQQYVEQAQQDSKMMVVDTHHDPNTNESSSIQSPPSLNCLPKNQNTMDMDDKKKKYKKPPQQCERKFNVDKQQNKETSSMDVDELTNQMSRLMIPRSVAFGRGAKRTLPHGIKTKQQQPSQQQ